jgi:hypothetical protein
MRVRQRCEQMSSTNCLFPFVCRFECPLLEGVRGSTCHAPVSRSRGGLPELARVSATTRRPIALARSGLDRGCRMRASARTRCVSGPFPKTAYVLSGGCARAIVLEGGS